MDSINKVLKMPALSEGSADGEGTIVAIPFSVGDRVEEGDTLLEVETDKVTLEIPAECCGTLDSVLLKVGDQICVGVEFARLSMDSRNTEPSSPSAQKIKNGGQQSTEIVKQIVIEDDIDTLISLQDSPLDRSDQPLDLYSHQSDPQARIIRANPSARRLGRELGIDLSQVTGTEKQHRITKEDVKSHSKKLLHAAASSAGSVYNNRRPLPDFSEFGEVRREPLSNIAHYNSLSTAS